MSREEAKNRGVEAVGWRLLVAAAQRGGVQCIGPGWCREERRKGRAIVLTDSMGHCDSVKMGADVDVVEKWR
jgi:hypothetical protein